MAKRPRARPAGVTAKSTKSAAVDPVKTIAIRLDNRGDVFLHLPVSSLEELYEIGRRVKFRKGVSVRAMDKAVSRAVTKRRMTK